MCYRGLHLQFPCASTRVDLNVILFLERQIIWFLLVYHCPSRACEPSSFYVRSGSETRALFPVLLVFICIHDTQHLHHKRVSHSGTLRLLSLVRKLQRAMNLLIESEFMSFRVVFAL